MKFSLDMDLSNCRECSSTVIQPYSWLDVMRKHDLIVWLRWVNKNLCEPIASDRYSTLMVKLRIATGMLNKLESLTDEEKIRIHVNLTTNVQAGYFYQQEKDLPF